MLSTPPATPSQSVFAPSAPFSAAQTKHPKPPPMRKPTAAELFLVVGSGFPASISRIHAAYVDEDSPILGT